MVNRKYLDAVPKTIEVLNENTGQKVLASVLSFNDRQIVTAIAGAKIILYKNQFGQYEGKFAGMNLFYRVPKNN